jgi:hypothetical protein
MHIEDVKTVARKDFLAIEREALKSLAGHPEQPSPWRCKF